MPWLIRAIDPLFVQQQFTQCLPPALKTAQLCAIRVMRHKPGRRCLIEYDLEVNRLPIQKITLIGKIRAKGTDVHCYQLQQALWNAGFADDSEDGISVPEPIALIPNLQMHLQRKVPGTIATELLPQSNGIALAQRIAEAAHKLHQANIPPHRRHTMTDELNILRDRLSQVMQQYPHWETRLQRILNLCDRLGAATPEIKFCGIHRDFYADQVLVDGSRLYLLDLDLYCQGDPGLDIGNFIGHMTEQGLRTLGDVHALRDREIALEKAFVQLSGSAVQASVQAYTALTLVRHIYLSTQFAERRSSTEILLQYAEQLLFAEP
ncbi:phosphotransferase [Microcoleus sp. FACHB-1515]|nr:phosphotransferase [Microcoleus sp. FACHB-1515]